MKTHDLVVFGATSFVGQILCRYLVQRHAAQGLRWAMAGRSMAKLEQLRASLGAGAGGVPLLVADADDEASLRALCSSAHVICSTVGPYALYGSDLVRVCAESGTDYCDLTGEVQWIRRMMDRYESVARDSGARIVHCCGFDSIPSDLGVYFLQQQALQRFDAPCVRVKLRVKAARGGFSGGTVASLLNVLKEARQDPSLRRLLADPYLLCPREARPTVPQPEVRGAKYDDSAGSWVAPFLMAGINTRIVHRSNALLAHRYGDNFRYDEAMMTGRGARGRAAAMATTAALAGLFTAGYFAPSRWLLERFVLPKPGEGPSAEAQARGFYDLRLHGRTAQGQTLNVQVRGDRDPGYGSTAKMLGEAAACLALDVPRSECPGGFWTPAAIFGERLLARLQAHAGVQFAALDSAETTTGR